MAFLDDRFHARRGAGPVGRPGPGPEAALGSQLGGGELAGGRLSEPSTNPSFAFVDAAELQLCTYWCC